MTFTPEHIRILEKNRPYYDGLQKNGTLNKMSSVILDEFEMIHNEVISSRRINTWCPACIVELIEIVYANYDKYIKENGTTAQDARPEQTGVKPELPALEDQRKKVQNARRTRR